MRSRSEPTSRRGECGSETRALVATGLLLVALIAPAVSAGGPDVFGVGICVAGHGGDYVLENPSGLSYYRGYVVHTGGVEEHYSSTSFHRRCCTVAGYPPDCYLDAEGTAHASGP